MDGLLTYQYRYSHIKNINLTKNMATVLHRRTDRQIETLAIHTMQQIFKIPEMDFKYVPSYASGADMTADSATQ